MRSLGGQTTVRVHWDARKLRGMTDAEMKTWPDYWAVLSSKPKSHSTSQTASFFFSPSFLLLLSLQRCMHFIYFLTISPLNSLTWLQPGGFFMNLGQQAYIKYAEDGIIGSEAKAEIWFWKKNYEELSSLHTAIDFLKEEKWMGKSAVALLLCGQASFSKRESILDGCIRHPKIDAGFEQDRSTG